MANQYIDELTNDSIRKLTRYLTLPVQYDVARPADEWFRDQDEKMRELPSVCLRPPGNSCVTDLIKRGLMKMSEKQTLPFLPHAATLCPTHKALNPWRIRSLFALLASEVMDKFERMRRLVRRNSDLADSPQFRAYVCRMTSIQALWMERDTFKRLFGHSPIGLTKIACECEACIAAAVGGDTRLLVDLRAHLLSRWHRLQPILLRVVEAWIAAFEHNVAHALYKESAVMSEQLKHIRAEVGKRRHERRQRRREAGKNKPYRKAKHEDNSNIVPVGPASNSDTANGLGQDGHEQPPPGFWFGYQSSVSCPQSVHSTRMHSTGIEDLPSHSSSGRPVNPFRDEHEEEDDDGDVEEATNDDKNAGTGEWMQSLGNYYDHRLARVGCEADITSMHRAFQRPSSQYVPGTRSRNDASCDGHNTRNDRASGSDSSSRKPQPPAPARDSRFSPEDTHVRSSRSTHASRLTTDNRPRRDVEHRAQGNRSDASLGTTRRPDSPSSTLSTIGSTLGSGGRQEAYSSRAATATSSGNSNGNPIRMRRPPPVQPPSAAPVEDVPRITSIHGPRVVFEDSVATTNHSTRSPSAIAPADMASSRRNASFRDHPTRLTQHIATGHVARPNETSAHTSPSKPVTAPTAQRISSSRSASSISANNKGSPSAAASTDHRSFRNVSPPPSRRVNDRLVTQNQDRRRCRISSPASDIERVPGRDPSGQGSSEEVNPSNDATGWGALFEDVKKELRGGRSVYGSTVISGSSGR